MDVDITNHSETVYSALCEIIGNEYVVELHRLYNTFESLMISSSSDKRKYVKLMTLMASRHLGVVLPDEALCINLVGDYLMNFRRVLSGSKAEGFDFQSSDVDMMKVVENVKVIHSLTEEYPSQPCMLLYAEKDYTRPGFVMMRLLQITPSLHVPLSWIWMKSLTKLGQSFYISSSKLLQESIPSALFSNTAGIDLNAHGPCMNITQNGKEFDIAITFSSDTWPVEAAGCIHRLYKRRWPSDDVIKDIVSDGCLFVAIGCKTSPYADMEWRMSFSLAEKRLVHSMNHSQFLTYGLLKVFLKEVVEAQCATKGLLCSYFMKTLVFWEVMDTNIPWTPCCFLQNVWNCYRRLLNWVSIEYCPNFFIPENNMFFGKIHGCTRRILFDSLSMHYRAGHSMFVEIPSIRNEIDRRETLQRQNLSHVEGRLKVMKLSYCITIMAAEHGAELYEALQKSKLTAEVKDFIRLSDLNFSYFRTLCCVISKVCHNKSRYLNEKSFFRLMKLSSPDCVRSKVFLALYLYRSKRYDGCVSVLHGAIRKMEDARTVSMWKFDPDKKFSLGGGDDLSIPEEIFKCTAFNVPLDSETCFPEILDECNAPPGFYNLQTISPWVLSYFLLSLCHFWTGDITQARVHLEIIRDCLQNRRHHTFDETIHLSWQMLGIGQEILGDFQDALTSYEKCKRSIEISNRIFFNDLLVVNNERSSRLKSMLRWVPTREFNR
ncbi:hypothetical protein FSP39_011077 [Pinctada imbricata]|uniref:Mab-21-like HhH/H2TH-like domain-containing protein n=1 Tax=Pinctada imbricata TaxID=66713 RepID=A0AA89C823_PINIB|nr:hypothetical protein FSP39_011077 [Pinctada imbricata]